MLMTFDTKQGINGNSGGELDQIVSDKQTQGSSRGRKNAEGRVQSTAEKGQTLLDASEGDIRIKKTGATVGGVSKDGGILHPKGY